MRNISEPAASANGATATATATTAPAPALAAARHPAVTSSQTTTTASGTTPQILTVTPSPRTAPPAHSQPAPEAVVGRRPASRPRSTRTTPPSRHSDPKGSSNVMRSAHAAAYDTAYRTPPTTIAVVPHRRATRVTRTAFAAPTSRKPTRAATRASLSLVHAVIAAKGVRASIEPGGCRSRKSRYGRRPCTNATADEKYTPSSYP